jgi:hypothetical protein
MARRTASVHHLGYGNWKVDTNAVSFNFGVKLAVCGNGSTAEQVSGRNITTVLLTDYRDRPEYFYERFGGLIRHR